MARSGSRSLPLWAKRLVIVVTCVAAGYVILSSPISGWWDQRGRLEQAENDLAALDADNQELIDRLDQASEPAELELSARRDLGMVRPGEESYTVLPPPTAGVALPDVWPFNRIAGAISESP